MDSWLTLLPELTFLLVSLRKRLLEDIGLLKWHREVLYLHLPILYPRSYPKMQRELVLGCMEVEEVTFKTKLTTLWSFLAFFEESRSTESKKLRMK